MQWKEIAEEYRKEIETLHLDIEHAMSELEKKVPRSFQMGIKMLETSLELSAENIRIVRYAEPLSNAVKEKHKDDKNKSKSDTSDSFEELLK